MYRSKSIKAHLVGGLTTVPESELVCREAEFLKSHPKRPSLLPSWELAGPERTVEIVLYNNG